MVSVLAFYSNGPSFNPAEEYKVIIVQNLIEKNENKREKVVNCRSKKVNIIEKECYFNKKYLI